MKEKLGQFMHRPTNLATATAILMVTMTLSNVLGLVRNVILSKNIPLDVLDAYYAAFNLPDLIFNILILGTVSSAFIPVFTHLVAQKGKEKGWELANHFLNATMLVMALLLLVLFFSMDPLVTLLTPGFTMDKHDLTVMLARTMIVSPFLFSVSNVIGGVLNSNKRFTAYAIAPLFYNIAIIVGGLMAPTYGVVIVAYAVVIGACLHILIQLPSVVRIGWRYSPILNWHDADLRRVLTLMGPRSLALAMNQVTTIAFTVIGSLLAPGAIAIYKLTNDLQTTAPVIFGNAIAVAAFPYISEKVSQNKLNEALQIVIRATRFMLFFLTPATLFMFILRAQIIRLYLALGHGLVDWNDTIRAINTLGFFALSLVAQGLLAILARGYYAHHDTKRPTTFSIIGAVISIGCAYPLGIRFDVAGLALAFAIGSWVNALLLITFYPKAPDEQHAFAGSISAIGKIIVASSAAAIVMWFVLRLADSGVATSAGTVSGVETKTVFGLAMQTMYTLFAGIVAYGILLYTVKSEELTWLVKRKKTFIVK